MNQDLPEDGRKTSLKLDDFLWENPRQEEPGRLTNPPAEPMKPLQNPTLSRIQGPLRRSHRAHILGKSRATSQPSVEQEPQKERETVDVPEHQTRLSCRVLSERGKQYIAKGPRDGVSGPKAKEKNPGWEGCEEGQQGGLPALPGGPSGKQWGPSSPGGASLPSNRPGKPSSHREDSRVRQAFKVPGQLQKQTRHPGRPSLSWPLAASDLLPNSPPAPGHLGATSDMQLRQTRFPHWMRRPAGTTRAGRSGNDVAGTPEENQAGARASPCILPLTVRPDRPSQRLGPALSKGLIKAGLPAAQEGNDCPPQPRRLPFVSVLSKQGKAGLQEEKKKRSAGPSGFEGCSRARLAGRGSGAQTR
ncbi:hypothetical protein P7K49_030196 [Saguinus oedipus]|uniref:Uncharacterized protein n=1 Tax=Saguinus oedipus TaxID=9490 RepID=A0ABQ9U1I6_SAGOE|nr:hypothetical protein P7K49_030196 [Saguinus oedipus]